MIIYNYRQLFILYSMVVATASIFCIIAPILDTKSFILPIPVALPYSVENPIIFWPTFVRQCITGFAVAASHLSVDNTFFGLLLLIKREQEVLKYLIRRLETYFTTFDSKSGPQKVIVQHELKRIIKDHQRMYRYLS